MIGDGWKDHSFEGYDAVVHVAGIAHIKETAENAHLYDEVNRALAIETAKKAKEAGVPHFILMSSMSVYGIDTGIITRDTVPSPVSERFSPMQRTSRTPCSFRTSLPPISVPRMS